MKTVSQHRAFGGVQGVYTHASAETRCDMTFAVYVPEHEPGAKLPVLWFLSGLTCTHANVVEKGEYRAACARLGIILVAPDTSPRGEGVADDDAYDLGQGAGFYLDATQEPWAAHYRMRSYLETELPGVIANRFPVDMDRQSVMGHSMGGHGALTMALREPGRFRSASAIAPIGNPSAVPWGRKAFTAYLGPDEADWAQYDAVRLIEDGARHDHLLVDQGTDDQFLTEQLKPGHLVLACRKAGMTPTIRMQAGYDHSYYTIATFMAEHIGWHAERLADVVAGLATAIRAVSAIAVAALSLSFSHAQERNLAQPPELAAEQTPVVLLTIEGAPYRLRMIERWPDLSLEFANLDDGDHQRGRHQSGHGRGGAGGSTSGCVLADGRTMGRTRPRNPARSCRVAAGCQRP